MPSFLGWTLPFIQHQAGECTNPIFLTPCVPSLPSSYTVEESAGSSLPGPAMQICLEGSQGGSSRQTQGWQTHRERLSCMAPGWGPFPHLHMPCWCRSPIHGWSTNSILQTLWPHPAELKPYRGVSWLKPTWAWGADLFGKLSRRSGQTQRVSDAQGETESCGSQVRAISPWHTKQVPPFLLGPSLQMTKWWSVLA